MSDPSTTEPTAPARVHLPRSHGLAHSRRSDAVPASGPLTGPNRRTDTRHTGADTGAEADGSSPGLYCHDQPRPRDREWFSQPPIPALREAAAHLQHRRSLAGQLSTTHEALAAVDDTLHGLIRAASPDRVPYLARAQSHAGTARAALARAPSVFWLFGSPRPAWAMEAEEHAVLADLLDLAEALVLSLVESADQADDPRDEAACIQASVQTCLLTKALNLALEVRAAPNAM